MKKLKTALVGIGSLGTAFLTYLEKSKKFELLQVFSSQKLKLKNAKLCSALNELDSEIDLIFLALPDFLVFETLEKLEKMRFQKTAVSFSGTLQKEKKFGFNYGFLHPVNTFPTKKFDDFPLQKIFWNASGDEKFLQVTNLVVSELEGEIFTLKNENLKPLYHAACVIASNLLVSLLLVAEEGIAKVTENKNSKEILEKLVKNTVENFFSEGKGALSGPLKRKDFATVEKNLASLEKNFPEASKIYKALSLNLVRVLDENFSEVEKQKTSERLK